MLETVGSIGRFMPISVLAFIVIWSCYLYSGDTNVDERHLNRRLTEMHSPTSRHFEFGGKRVINTTTPMLYSALKKELVQRIRSNTSLELQDSEIAEGVNRLQNELGWNPENNNFNNLSIFFDTLPAMNNYHYQINDPKANSAVKKKIEEQVSNDYAHLEDHVINGMFDIIVLTGNSSLDVNFLEDWKEAIEHIHLIIIQQGDPNRFVSIPSWADYELYTKLDVIKAVGEADSWIFDMDGNSNAAVNFGFIVADRNFVFILDRDCVPINEHHHHLHKYDASGLSGLFRGHANNLMRPTAPFYYNNHDPYTTVDGKETTSDYVRGHPYSLRGGLQTAISYGSVFHSQDTDALTRLMKLNPIQPVHSHSKPTTSGDGVASAGQSFDADQQSHTNNNNDMIVTVAYGSLFSLSLRNVAFNRKVFGFSFMMLSAVQRRVNLPIGVNYDIIAGWFMKRIADHCGLGVKHSISPLYLEYKGDSAVSDEKPHGQLFDELKADLVWLSLQEAVVTWFNSVEISPKTRDDVQQAANDLAKKMESELAAVHPAFAQMGALIQKFTYLYDFRNGFQATYLPISSRSSHAPQKDSPHQCAAFTIVHNETSMMDVWLRYYGKHLPNAVWLLNHHTSTSDVKANRLQLEERILGRHFNVTVDDLHGDGHGFPMGFLVKTADLYQRRLLRYGYKCVVLSDVDEILIPDPDKYPGGLSEYLTKFVQDDSKKIFRAIGHIIAHISNPDGDENSNLEPAIDWTKPIMSQRNFYFPQPKYNKPLVSKVPVHYKPGFHGAFIPALIHNDVDLLLFHLREVDKEFCLAREYLKYQLMVQAHQSEIDMALNTHIMNFPEMLKKGETCQFGLSTYYKKYGGAFDNTGKNRLVPLEEKWKNITV